MNIIESPDKDTDYSVPALARGLSVLAMFDARTRSLSMQEIAARLGITPSAVYRILFTLTDMGYLNKHNTQYELGARVISDGFSYLASRDIVEVAMPHLNDLRDRTSLSCHLSIREQTDSLYLYRAFAAQRLSVNIPVGTHRLPLHGHGPHAADRAERLGTGGVVSAHPPGRLPHARAAHAAGITGVDRRGS